MKVFIQDFKTKTTYLEENVHFLPKRALLTRKMHQKRATFKRNRALDLNKAALSKGIFLEKNCTESGHVFSRKTALSKGMFLEKNYTELGHDFREKLH